MSTRSPIIGVNFSGSAQEQTVHGVFQYDHGLKLRITGLSGVLEVHYAFEGMGQTLLDTPTADDGGYVSSIPDVLLMQPKPVYGYVYVNSGDAGYTVRVVKLIVEPRPTPTDQTYTPEEISTIEGLIGQLNEMIEHLEQADAGTQLFSYELSVNQNDGCLYLIK